jgi:hypothetical protein
MRSAAEALFLQSRNQRFLVAGQPTGGQLLYL